MYYFHREIAKQLVEDGGADISLKDNFGRTPSNIAKEMAQSEVMHYLNRKMKELDTKYILPGFPYMNDLRYFLFILKYIQNYQKVN